MGLESLNVLFLLINATGFFPYRMVLNKKKKSFECFDVGWCHPATWWFVVVLFIQLIHTPYNTTIAVMGHIYEKDKKESVICEMAMVLWFFCYGIVKLIPTIVLFRIRNLMTALTDLKKVDQILNKIQNKPQCSSRQRTVIGFVCAVSLIVTVLISAGDWIFHHLETKEIIYKSFDLLADFMTSLQFTTWLLLFHLTYYSISHRIAILGYLIGDEAPISRGRKITVVPVNTINIEHNPTDEQLRFRLQRVDYVIDRLAKTCCELRCVFSFPALIILLTSLLSCSINIFLLLRKFIQPNSSDEGITFLLVNLTQQIVMALVVIVSADMPAKEVKRLRSKFLRLSTKNIDAIDEAKCAAILLALSEERFQLSAGGLMPIGKELLPSLISSVITYLVILLQNAIHKKANQDKGKVNG